MSDKLSDEQLLKIWKCANGTHPDLGIFTRMVIDYGRAVLAAASPAPAIPAVHWQPIETAPKDGSMILMWVHANRHLIDEDGNPYEENFAAVDFGEWKEFGEHGGAFIAYSCPHGDGADGITHWMPLPIGPTDDALKAAPAISESEDARKTCMCSGLGPCERRTDGSCRVSAPANLASAISRHVVIDWAVERWTLEVSGRPLGNIQRRSLDDAWRQFIRYLGADDVSLLGPRHDDLIAAHSLSIPMPDSEGGEA
ncbi:hypothetical protein [Burkholderia glumae]